MNFSVIGTGAIGGYYGGLLAHAGQEVHFLIKSDYDHVKAHGLFIQSDVLGAIHVDPVHAYRHVIEMPISDVVLICLKSTENKSLLPKLLPPLLHSGTVVIPIQNGLGIEKDIAAMFPGISVVGGIAQIAANKTGPGALHHQDYGYLELGSYNVADTTRLDKIVAAFENTAIQVSATDDLAQLRWRKLVWNVTFNGLSVILNTTTDRILKVPSARSLAKKIMLEVIAGAQACKVDIPELFADELLEFTGKMHPYAPSMKLDYDFGRPLEIHYIYENPVDTAKAAGYYMSTVDVLAKQLLFMAGENRATADS
jgi:2-dehydropantoate 2-reductase